MLPLTYIHYEVHRAERAAARARLTPSDDFRRGEGPLRVRIGAVLLAVAEFLRDEIDLAQRKVLQERTLASIKRFRAGDRLSRDDLHRRDALR